MVNPLLGLPKKPPDPKTSMSDTRLDSTPQTSGSEQSSWSGTAAAVQFKELTLTLQHVGEVEPAPLTNREIVSLLLNKLKVPCEVINGIDSSF